MSDLSEVQARVDRDVAEARARMDAVDEGHKRWNRMEEAMDSVCEEAISIFDQVGRGEQADEIQSHMAAHERFELLLKVFAEDTGSLFSEAAEAGLTEDYEYCRLAFPALQELAKGVQDHRPGA